MEVILLLFDFSRKQFISSTFSYLLAHNWEVCFDLWFYSHTCDFFLLSLLIYYLYAKSHLINLRFRFTGDKLLLCLAFIFMVLLDFWHLEICLPDKFSNAFKRVQIILFSISKCFMAWKSHMSSWSLPIFSESAFFRYFHPLSPNIFLFPVFISLHCYFHFVNVGFCFVNIIYWTYWIWNIIEKNRKHTTTLAACREWIEAVFWQSSEDTVSDDTRF